jgi:hypothetical protein
MRVYPLDTNKNLEFELKLIHQYEKYDNKIQLLKENNLDKNDKDYVAVHLLDTVLPNLLERKNKLLDNNPLHHYLHKLNSKKGIRHKINMKKY